MELVLKAGDLVCEKEKYIEESTQEWIGDSGASHHITNSLLGMSNIRKLCESEKVQVGDGGYEEITLVGNVTGKVRDTECIEITITLKDVSYVPNFVVKLFSITRALANG